MGNLCPRTPHWVGGDFVGAASWSEALTGHSLFFRLYLSQVLPPQHISSSPNAVSLSSSGEDPQGTGTESTSLILPTL